MRKWHVIRPGNMVRSSVAVSECCFGLERNHWNFFRTSVAFQKYTVKSSKTSVTKGISVSVIFRDSITILPSSNQMRELETVSQSSLRG
jgi:hypothetical protein